MFATIHVFTFKAGLLARLAHDLRLTLQRYEAKLVARQLHALAFADSLVVDGTMTDRGLDPQGLSAKDQRQVLETVQSEILESQRYPRIELDGAITTLAANVWKLRGELRLKGRTKPFETELIRSGDTLQATFELKPSEYGIAPYKALAGAIKLDDRVRVSISVTLDGQEPEDLLTRSEPLQL
jgi:hypothetical protein